MHYDRVLRHFLSSTGHCLDFVPLVQLIKTRLQVIACGKKQHGVLDVGGVLLHLGGFFESQGEILMLAPSLKPDCLQISKLFLGKLFQELLEKMKLLRGFKVVQPFVPFLGIPEIVMPNKLVLTRIQLGKLLGIRLLDRYRFLNFFL